MDKGRSFFAATAAGIGVGIIVFIIDKCVSYHEHKKYQKNIKRLQEELSNVQTELHELRQKSYDNETNNRRRRRKKSSRTTDGYESDSYFSVYTAVSDTDDDQFYDFSSEDENESGENVESTSGSDSESSFFIKMDKLLRGSTEDQKEALQCLLSKISKFENNADFLWRLGRAYRSQAQFAEDDGDKNAKKHFINIGLKYARKSVELDNENADGHKWFAILLGMNNEFLGTKEKIQNGALFKEHLEMALIKKPDDYSLHHLLARFKFEVTNLSWIEKKVAATVFGALPDVTMESAIEDAERAEELNPDPWPDNRLLLAKCYIAKGESDKIKEWLYKANDAFSPNSQDKSLQLEVESLIQKYCRY